MKSPKVNTQPSLLCETLPLLMQQSKQTVLPQNLVRFVMRLLVRLV